MREKSEKAACGRCCVHTYPETTPGWERLTSELLLKKKFMGEISLSPEIISIQVTSYGLNHLCLEENEHICMYVATMKEVRGHGSKKEPRGWG